MVAMQMAFRATATATSPHALPSTLSSSCAPRLPKPTSPSSQFKPISLSLPTSSASLSLFALVVAPDDANALSLSKDQIVSSLTQVENVIDQVQEKGSGVLNFSLSVLQAVIDTVKPAVDVALPILQKTGGQALKIASPAISEASKKAQEAIQSSGIDTEPVISVAKIVVDAAQQTTKVIEEAKPIASSTVQTISSSDPVLIAGTTGAIFITYLLFPSIWSGISYGLRGYKGELSPAQTLDLISSQNYIMIDIRSEKDKNKAGIPRLPSSAKNNTISIPLEELPGKIKNIVKNTKKVEAEIAALKISYLKRISKGSNIVIMDSYSDTAKIVARALTSLGFKKCWIMADGFSGNRGWLQSRLGIDSYNVTFAEVLSPSRIIPAATRRFGSTSSTSLQSSQKFLPRSSE